MLNPDFESDSESDFDSDFEPKDFYEEIKRLEREGYDKTRFCDAECALIHCCDDCALYDFKPGDCGCYLDAGQCDIHGHTNPEDGQDCPDFICSSLKSESEYKKNRSSRIKEKIFQARQGINICKDCWANIFCPTVLKDVEFRDEQE